MTFVSETVMEPGLEKQTRTVPAPLRQRVDPKPGPTMKAVYLERTVGSEGLVAGEIPRPSPREGEVLVRVVATAVMPTEQLTEIAGLIDAGDLPVFVSKVFPLGAAR